MPITINGSTGISGVDGSSSTPALQGTDSNTGISFPAADTVAINTGGTERSRVDSSGRLLLGTSTSPSAGSWSQYSRLIAKGNTTGSAAGGVLNLGTAVSATSMGTNDSVGVISFSDLAGNEFATIAAFTDGTISSTSDLPGKIVFSTTADGAANPTERMRITNAGRLFLNTTDGANPTIAGKSFADFGGHSSYGLWLQSHDEVTAYFNRQANDGTIVDFRQATIQEGTISVSGNTVSYNQFLGSHWASLTDWSRPEIKLGTILETINELTDWKYAAIEVDGEQKKICYNGTAAPGDTVSVEYQGETYEGIVELETNPEFNKAVKVKVNDTAASKAVYGVFVGWNNDSSLDGGIWNDMYVGAVGNYVIRMAAGQEPEIGDLVVADGTGCAVVQDDDIIRTKTVAKITSTIPQVTYDDGSFLVTCVLYCG